MSELAESIIDKAEDIHKRGIDELEKLRVSIKQASPQAVATLHLTAEDLDKLPWKPHRNGKGQWIFSDLKEPAAQRLRAFLDRAGSKADLYGFHYSVSGDRKKFINRFEASASAFR